MGWGIHGGVFYEHRAALCHVSRFINGPHRTTGHCGENLSFVRSNIVISYGLKCDVARWYPACLSTFQPLFFMKTPRSYSPLLLRLSQETTFAWYFRLLDDVIALHSRLSEPFHSLLVWSNFPRRRITVPIRSLTLTIPIIICVLDRASS